MKKGDITRKFQAFLQNYDSEAKDALWQKHRDRFRSFWNSKILNGRKDGLNDLEIDETVRILDIHGKGNTKTSEAVARVMVPQGAWRRMFRDIKNNGQLAALLDNMFREKDPGNRASLIDQIYEINRNTKNNLTGESGSAVNAMLAAYDPFANLSVISLNDRKKILIYFRFEKGPDFDHDTTGKKIVTSNTAILEGLRSLGLEASARTLSVFFYSSEIKNAWKPETTETETAIVPAMETKESRPHDEEEGTDRALFYMESQLEDFLIENWDKTILGRKYDLIKENGELVSQQYRTPIGNIDILAQEKDSGRLIVIELKKDQTSDDTVGQLARYMGWLEQHKTNSKPTKGIIIAGHYDERLYYALKKLADVEVYLYRVDFNLQEFKK